MNDMNDSLVFEHTQYLLVMLQAFICSHSFAECALSVYTDCKLDMFACLSLISPYKYVSVSHCYTFPLPHDVINVSPRSLSPPLSSLSVSLPVNHLIVFFTTL